MTSCVADINDDKAKQLFLAKMIAGQQEDRSIANSLLKACNDFAGEFKNKLLPCLNALTKNLSDQHLQAQFSQIIDSLNKKSDHLFQLSSKAGVDYKLSRNARHMGTLADQTLLFAAQGNRVQTVATLRELADKLRLQKALEQSLASQCKDPPLAKPLLDAIDKLERDYKQVVLDTKTLLANPNDTAARAKLKVSVDQFKTSSLLTAKLANVLKAKIDANEKESARRTLEAERKRRLEEQNRNAIYRAAKKLEDVTFNLIENDTPVGMLVKCGNMIAQAIVKLSKIAETGSKRDMILASRNIAQFVNEVVKWARLCASQCKDKHLARELIDASRIAKNFAIQLKILAAVKASQGPNDKTAMKLLETCARGLCNAVIDMVKVSQVAKLKKTL